MIKRNSFSLFYGCLLLINASESFLASNRNRNYAMIRRVFFNNKSWMNNGKREFVDAEVISDNKTNKKESDQKITLNQPISLEKKDGGILSSITNSISKWFGQDEESLRKKQQKKEINTAIDKVFENTGLFHIYFHHNT